MKKENIIFIFFILVFVFIIFYSIYSKIFEYILDSSVSMFLITILFILYRKLDLNKVIFSLIFLALFFHDLGIFGFYNNSPFTFQYDHLTHFVGGFSISVLLVNYLKKYFSNKKINNIFLIIIAFLATLGIGSIIEIIEYAGYLVFGEGQGFLYFGGTGDIVFNS